MSSAFVLFLGFLSLISAEKLHNGITQVDLIKEGLKNQEWSSEETPCYQQTMYMLDHVQNYTVWAMWMWNSMQHPVGTFHGAGHALGHYDQCLQAPSKASDPQMTAQYCLADVQLSSQRQEGIRNVMGDSETYLGAPTRMKRDMTKLSWGVCLPSVCKSGSVVKILKTIYMVNPITPVEPNIEITYCEAVGAKQGFSSGFYVYFSFIFALVIAAVISTIYVNNANPKLASTRIASIFCLKRNWSSLTKKPTDDIPLLNFYKVLLSSHAVIIHAFYFQMNGPISNVLEFDDLMSANESDGGFKKFVKTIDMGIDVFFVMSGLFLVKGFMEKRKKPVVSIMSRYFRLIGTFALVTFYMAFVSIYTGDGPLWQKLAGREQQASAKSWLWALLMLNNCVGSEDITQIVAWHIPCDFQLAVMGTILFAVWQKNPRIGKMAAIFISILAVLAPAFVTYWKKLPAILLFDDVEKLTNFRVNEVYINLYIMSYNRAVPYLLGMAMGYIIATYKPAMNRGIVSMESSTFIMTAGYITLYKVTTSALTWCQENDTFSTLTYLTFNKVFFALTLCAIIGVSEYGNLPLVRKFTGLHIFAVLSKLTYGVYLTHSIFLQKSSFSKRHLYHYDIFSEIMNGFGVIVFCYIAATLLWLFVEAPLNNIVNLVTNSGSQKLEINGVHKDNSKNEPEEIKYNENKQESDTIENIIKYKAYNDKIKAL